MIKNYALMSSLEELQSLADMFLAEGTPVGIDIETGYDGPDKANASLHPQEGFIVGISITNSTDWARYIPLRHDYQDNFDNKDVAAILWPVLKSGLCVAHNALFELSFFVPWLLEYLGADIVGDGVFKVRSCTMIEAALMAKYRKIGLKELVLEIFQHTMVHFEELFPGAKKDCLRTNVLGLGQDVVDYTCEDALWALALHLYHYPQLKDSFIYKLEMGILDVLRPMEEFGVRFDWQFLRDLTAEAQAFEILQKADIQETFSEMLGEPVSVNLNSPKQVHDLLYKRLGFATTRFTKSSQDSADPKMSTDAKALETLAKQQPVVRKLLESREVKKLQGSYTKKFERDFGYDTERYGFTHPHHSQVRVISGRFAVSDPNYQQLIGGNTEYEDPHPLAGKKMTRYECRDLSTGGTAVLEYCFRDCVIVPDDYYAVGLDYSQAELRALAGESGETYLLDAFKNGDDVHEVTGYLLLGENSGKNRKEVRKVGKTGNFSLLYGQGIKAMGESLGIPYEDAEILYNKYFSVYSKIKDYVDTTVAFARKNGYTVTKFGRKMRIWEYDDPRGWVRSKADRMAVNTVIQGSATGDVPKIAMIRATQAIKEVGLADKVHLVMNVHDALEFYVHKSVPVQTVLDLLEPAVVFPVDGWPTLVADWHMWERWGTCTDMHRNEEGKWVPKK